MYDIKLDTLDKWIQDDNVTDIIYCNGELWIEDLKKGYYQEDIKLDSSDIDKIASQLANSMGVNYNHSNGILDGETEDMRFNAIHPSLTGTTVSLAIRKTPTSCRLNDKYIQDTNYLDGEGIKLLKSLVEAKANIIIGGETGTGKTELVKYLMKFKGANERVVLIEDTRECHLKRLYPTHDILELKSNERYNFKSLIKTSLRQKMEWLVISEVRGEEINDLLESISTGHTSITTIHTSSAKDIPRRMVNMMGISLEDTDSVINLIHEYIDIGIYIYKNQKNGVSRRIYEIVEFYNDDHNQPVCHTLFQLSENIKYSKIKSPTLKRKYKMRGIESEFVDEVVNE